MKKTIAILISTCALLLAGAFCAGAQTEHLTFKGVPIDGTISEVCKELENKGLTFISADETMGVLKGTFAGYSNCFIGVSGREGRAAGVTVLFSDCSSWNEVSGQYFALKDALEQKYGEPSNCVERFETSPSSDFMKYYAATNGQCIYATTFSVAGGKVTLRIGGSDSGAYAALHYQDGENFEAARKIDSEDL